MSIDPRRDVPPDRPDPSAPVPLPRDRGVPFDADALPPAVPAPAGSTGDAPPGVGESRQNVPNLAYAIGMYLFLAALGVLFAATMLLYVIVRGFNDNQPAFGYVTLPWELWVSTALVLAASVTVHLAVKKIQHERQLAFRRLMAATLGLAVLFTAVQTPALIELLNRHFELVRTGTTVYGIIFFLVIVHALHVVGGIVYLVLVTANAYRNRYDHESYLGPRHAALYWHFLDVVWIVMFGTLLAFG